KITRLLANGVIIQIKRGLYAFTPDLQKNPLSLEVVAAALQQPSYISREYALYRYGILTEHAKLVTSMTTRRRKHFDTPVGSFDFYSLHPTKFRIGVEAKEITGVGGYLMATKEKAFADWVASLPTMSHAAVLRSFLFEESRIDPSFINQFNFDLLVEISQVYKNKNVTLLTSL
ncbi:MAG: hypothetical protein LLG04_16130, partial [Parachlamydia sp.]|nr:hypothetical protein [Parachlamydia sp.]